jgi:type VI secretion system protein ImpK
VAPLAGPTIKQLLASEEQNGSLSVEEDGGLTRITLLGQNLFASGNATLNPGNQQTFGRVAAALNSVPGRVLVIGHTDAQPIQSLRYRDNYDLSRERAASVAALLQQSAKSATIEVNGVGPDKPLVNPEVTAADRARNRRVEILHLRES